MRSISFFYPKQLEYERSEREKNKSAAAAELLHVQHYIGRKSSLLFWNREYIAELIIPGHGPGDTARTVTVHRQNSKSWWELRKSK